MHFICICDRISWLVVQLSFMKPALFVLLQALCIPIHRDFFFYISTIWMTDDDKSLQQTQEEGSYIISEQKFF